MSFSTDREALDCLSALIFGHRYICDVVFEDGEVIAAGLDTAAAVFEAASATGDPVRLTLRKPGDSRRAGVFLVLLQDDPSCLVVDHSTNPVCEAIFDLWFARCEAVQ